MSDQAYDTAVFDVDGTLVDSNYHHVLAWYRAFRRFGLTIPCWRIHRATGQGGDQIVGYLAGDDVERQHGDDLRDAYAEEFSPVRDEIQPFGPAQDLLQRVKERGLEVVLASSGKEDDVEHFVDILGVRGIATLWTSSKDAEQSKPAPDIVEVAVGRAGAAKPVMVGDSVWDVKAAQQLGIPTVCVRNGGFGVDELREAGAVEVWESLDELLDGLDRSILGG
ncbi:HAD superfamily hydrolase (TIGR01549 family) [Motilibacter rhizosphaerae]|uniref:HAD superfamily hydrolase (TIGR01549 family) n=1 Tax=Motilibacter rhizosphaerae TaxID=598652 RepID=A0A4Q7NVC6_9ACTN|nr:HAD family hydrolase [Motilibacter rhizosphaerae]RZS90910.1 HAD superfamily hydrolase (TIGR01549 family) [Motilibacter rhizosphaerae]